MSTETLHSLFNRKSVILPGIFHPLSALIARDAGFEALYLSGSALSACHGLPDLELLKPEKIAQAVAQITSRCSLPLLVDIDTGFGRPRAVARTVRLVLEAGACGIHLEDQRSPKRCGHLEGKKLVTVPEMNDKILAAKAAVRGRPFLVIARTDARGVEGFEGAVSRAKQYLSAGADGIFPEALESRTEFLEFRRRCPSLLIANMTEFGRTPYLLFRDFCAMGYRGVLFPVTALRGAIKTLELFYRTLKREGTQRRLIPYLSTRRRVEEILEYKKFLDKLG